MARVKIAVEDPDVDAAPEERVGSYFKKERSNTNYIKTGCTPLDMVLGGGWGPLGRVVNIVGNASSGKTLLAIEACANFARDYPEGKIWYNEVEHAFDVNYAETLGLPLERVDFVEGCESVEDVFEDLEQKLKDLDKDTPAIYILDSLDSLSDDAELARNIKDSSFGASKAKLLSQLFRRLSGKLSEKNVLLFVISQIRDNIGAMMGEKYTRSGGKALEFYSSQIAWLTYTGEIKKTKGGIEKVIGVNVKMKCKKNKSGDPKGSCEYPILFNFGIENVTACLDLLKKYKRISEEDYKVAKKELNNADTKTYRDLNEKYSSILQNVWYEVEEDFRPKMSKYGD